MIVAIDGPAASGKSTAARALAKALGLTFLDTGAMYRAVTLVALEREVDPSDESACGAIAEEVTLTFDADGRIVIDDRPGEPAVRGPEVTRNVSEVSAHPRVRRAMVAQQRAIARATEEAGGGTVAEGRDTTTVVFPDADLKVFLVASPAVRAKRRALEEGKPEAAAEYEADLRRRDELDSTREDSPLKEAEGAFRLVTDGLSADEVLERLVEAARERRSDS